jgi:hypothetical protein
LIRLMPTELGGHEASTFWAWPFRYSEHPLATMDTDESRNHEYLESGLSSAAPVTARPSAARPQSQSSPKRPLAGGQRRPPAGPSGATPHRRELKSSPCVSPAVVCREDHSARLRDRAGRRAGRRGSSQRSWKRLPARGRVGNLRQHRAGLTGSSGA